MKILGMKVSKFVCLCVFLIGYVSVLTYCSFFSPSARYNVSDEELKQLAIEYDLEHNTDYSSQF